MRVDWCQTHGRLATGNVKGDSDACPQDRAVDPCRVVPSVVVPLADVEGLVAKFRTASNNATGAGERTETVAALAMWSSRASVCKWAATLLAELIGEDDE